MKHWKKLFWRSFQESSVQIWRNKFLTGSTVLLGALILFLLNFVFSVNFFVNYGIKNLEKRADFSISLRENFDAFSLEALKNELKNKQFDIDINFLPEENFDDFSVPARLNIKFNNLEQVSGVLKIFKKSRYDEIIADWDSEGEADFLYLIQKLLFTKKIIKNTAFWFVILFLGGGILLTINTFRLILFARKEEIFIAKVVGAEYIFISLPFFIEGFLLGLMSSLVTIIIFVFALKEINIEMSGEIFLYLWNNIFAWEILISALVGMIGAYLAINKYLFKAHF